MAPLPHRLGWTTSPEVAGRRPVLLVPLGSTEQHGPHLPLDTDTRIATAVADAVADRHDGQVLVAPPLPYGSSGEHAGFAGTLSIGQAATEAVLVELVRAAGDDFALVVLVNGHGGNAEPVARAVATLLAEGRAVASWWPAPDGGPDLPDPAVPAAAPGAPTLDTPTGDAPAGPAPAPIVHDTHAGRYETSILLHLAPELVRLDRAEPGRTEPLADLIDDLRAGGVRSVAPNGVLGDPSGSDALLGGILFGGLVDDLDAFVAAQVAARGGARADGSSSGVG